MIVIDKDKAQEEIFRYMFSEEFDKMFDSTIFRGSADAKAAMRHGLSMAAIIVGARCIGYEAEVKADDEQG